MITIQIGSEKKSIEDHYESWLSQQIINRKKNGAPVCVEVFVKTNNIDIVLTTPDCPKGSYSQRTLRPNEKAIFDFWRERVLNEKEFSPGILISFLKQLKKLI